MIYLELFVAYLKIGFFGFGGGYSMLSLLYHEVVVNHAWITGAELGDIIAISQMTPGPIAINSATYVGYTIAGFWGSVLATVAVCLPSLTIMVLITQFFLRLRHSNYMERLMTAMRPSVMGMILAASMLLIFPEQKSGASMIDLWSWLLFGAAFICSIRRVNPITLIILSAVAGIAIYYLPTLFDKSGEWGEQVSATTTPHNIWRGYDVANPEVIASAQFEEAWVDYLLMLESQMPQVAAQQIATTFSRTQSSPEATSSLLELCEKYLYNPSSPIRSDELFIPALEYAVQCEQLDELQKIRPAALLSIASRNRVGQRAANFELDTHGQMHSIEAPLTLLYFYDDDCGDCRRTSRILSESEVISSLETQGTLAIVRTLATGNDQVDSLYDLKAIPTLYLLDNLKRVILKDPPIEFIIESLTSTEIQK